MAAGLVHLDTNILILSSSPEFGVRKRLQRWSAERTRIAVSAMVWAEFRCGPVQSALLELWERTLSGAIVPVDEDIAEKAAELFNLTGRRARSLPDCLIAATAIRCGAPLVTLNRPDFEPLVAHGLILG